MNSQQRRQSKRKFSHCVKLVAQPGYAYFDHDNQVMTARDWCNQHSQGEFRVSTHWDHAEFRFATQKDAVLFALKCT